MVGHEKMFLRILTLYSHYIASINYIANIYISSYIVANLVSTYTQKALSQVIVLYNISGKMVTQTT